jgi:hypothetical protein
MVQNPFRPIRNAPPRLRKHQCSKPTGQPHQGLCSFSQSCYYMCIQTARRQEPFHLTTRHENHKYGSSYRCILDKIKLLHYLGHKIEKNQTLHCSLQGMRLKIYIKDITDDIKEQHSRKEVLKLLPRQRMLTRIWNIQWVGQWKLAQILPLFLFGLPHEAQKRGHRWRPRYLKE